MKNMHWQDTGETLLIGFIVCDALRNSGGKLLVFFSRENPHHMTEIL